MAEIADKKSERILFSQKFACPVSGFTIEEIEPRLFSFNNPHGACPACDGLGTDQYVDADLVVPDPKLSLREGAIAPWSRSTSPYYGQTLEALARHFKFSHDHALEEAVAERAQDVILYGTGEEDVAFTYDDGLRSYRTKKPFEGVINNLERRWRETESSWMREEIERYLAVTACPACNGFRLKPEALAVKVNGLHVGEVAEMSIVGGRRVVRRAAEKAHAEAERDREPHSERDPRAAAVPEQCRARLSDAVARRGLALGRREPAHPLGLADRLGAHGRALCAGRAFHRAAPARQCAASRHAQAPARSRQHRDRGRARRGGDPRRRPCHRHGPGRGRPWRRGGGRRHARRHHGEPEKPHGAISDRRAANSRCRSCAAPRRATGA